MAKRSSRRDEARRMLVAELQGLHPEWSERHCEQEAERELRLQDENPFYADERLDVAPELMCPDSTEVASEVEARVWVEHPAMQWLIGLASAHACGRPADRRTLFAAMLHMVAGSRPEVKMSLRTIAQSLLLTWALRAPDTRSSSSAAYHTLRVLTERHPAGMCIHVNVAMVLELVALTQPKGKKRRARHVLRDMTIDGTLVPANVPQRAPKGRSPRARKQNERRIAGPDRPMVQYVIYAGGKVVATANDPQPAKQGFGRDCFGYKLMELRSIKLQVSLIWTLIPAGGNEREALRALIRALYKLVPKFPMRYLVGDRAYGNDTRLIEWLDRCYGIVGVFPLHANIRKDLSYSKTGGVPKCRHGWARHLGVRNEWAPERRWEMGLAPGVPAPGVPSHRWQCPAGQKCSEIRGTSAGEDWRLFSPLPHAGLSRLAARRAALSCYRNIQESGFSAQKHRGVGADWPPRLRLRGDDPARWVLSLARLRETAARLAHADGSYERALKRAIDLGLIEMKGEYPVPINGLTQRTAEQASMILHDVVAPLDAWPPETTCIAVTLPIDEPYRLPSLSEFSDIPDRPDERRKSRP